MEQGDAVDICCKMEGEISTKLHKKKHEEKHSVYKANGCTPKGESKKRFTWGHSLKLDIDPEEVITKTAELPKSCTDASVTGSPIQEFYSGAHVLITGATGFMGKALVEKLLVTCPKLEKMYLVIREKRGKSIQERFDILFQDAIFARLRETVPDFRKKIVAITGDCAEVRLGLSDEDYAMLSQTVNIIVHGAATVKFDEKIRIATHINVRGVKEMMQFCRTCSNLKSFVHISTAYANSLPGMTEVEEKFYPPACDYNKLIDLVNSESDEKLEQMLSSIISPWPNSYAFTKQVAENVVEKESEGLPIAVYRPAIVIATSKEPIRGWTDNIYGPTGLIVGSGTGVLRVVNGYLENYANIVPLDMAINGVIAATWKAHVDFQLKNSPKMYNYVSSHRNGVTWGELGKWSFIYGCTYPTVKCIWHPIFLTIRNRLIYIIVNFLLHTLPSYVADGFLFLTGNKTKLIKAYRKIHKFTELMNFFANGGWSFPDDNVADLWRSLSPEDKEIYPFDIEDLDWDFYCHTYIIGCRVHIIKDSLDTIEAARMKYRRLLLQHIALVTCLSIFTLWLLTMLIGWIFI